MSKRGQNVLSTKGKWPGFVPIDPNATCKRCGESWQKHGVGAESHCPPCPKRGGDLRNVGAAYTCCQKIINHKGKCKHA